MVAQASLIGDSFFAFVSVENRVQLAVSNDPQEVTHFVLDSGVWEVSGQVGPSPRPSLAAAALLIVAAFVYCASIVC
jgi:hypothetical protein